MTVISYTQRLFRGLSGDAKPSSDLAEGAVFYETDTNKRYIYLDTTWRLDISLFTSFSGSSPTGSTGTFYMAGFYDCPAADANLNQGSLTVTHGGANASYAAHAVLIASGAGSVDAGSCTIVASGTSMDDQGTRATGDSETIVSDITAMSTNEYFETTKKWLGTITYTLTPSGASTYNADFNYGFCKYDDFGNRDFVISDFECVGRAGGNDNNFDIKLFHHSSSGWIYHATAFVAGGAILAQLSADHSIDDKLINGDPFAYKRDNLSTAINGRNSEGVVIAFITTANNAVETINAHIGIHIVG